MAAMKKYDVTFSLGGRSETYTVEATTGVPENLGNGLLKIGDFTVREGALISVLPTSGKKVP